MGAKSVGERATTPRRARARAKSSAARSSVARPPSLMIKNLRRRRLRVGALVNEPSRWRSIQYGRATAKSGRTPLVVGGDAMSKASGHFLANLAYNHCQQPSPATIANNHHHQLSPTIITSDQQTFCSSTLLRSSQRLAHSPSAEECDAGKSVCKPQSAPQHEARFRQNCNSTLFILVFELRNLRNNRNLI